MDHINFGASSYTTPKKPFEFNFVFVLNWTAETLTILGKLSLPFEPYIVSAGRFYVISADTLEPKLLAIASVVLDVRNKFIHTAPHSFEGIQAIDLKYRDVFMALLREGITHVPPDIHAATELVAHLALIEHGYLDLLKRKYEIARPVSHVAYSKNMDTLWDSSNTLRKSIQLLDALVKQCDKLAEDEKGAALTENHLAVTKLLPANVQQSIGLPAAGVIPKPRRIT